MRSAVIIAAIILLGYFGYSAFRGGDEGGGTESDTGMPTIGSEPGALGESGTSGEPGWDDEESGPQGASGSDGMGEDGVVHAIAPRDEPAPPAPAVGEIPALEKQLAGTVSPERDELRLRLAAAYGEAGRMTDADAVHREVFRGRGPLAVRAAAALLDRASGEARTEAAAYVIERGPKSPGYGRAARIHGEALADSKGEEKEQLEGWRLLSAAYFSRPEESWRRELRPVLDELVARWFVSPRPCSLSIVHSVVRGDYLALIAEDNGVSVDHILALNGLDSNLIHPGDRLKILGLPITLEVDKSEFRLDVRYDGGYLMSFPVGHGAHGRTPVADFVVNIRQENPIWYPANRPSVPYGQVGNPLGERWLGFASEAGLTGFGIHGTDKPETIGSEASEGCVRLRNEDVIRLYPFVAIGTPVKIVE